MSEELKNCPFCGGNRLMKSGHPRFGVQILCKCFYDPLPEDAAIERWNTRAYEAEIEALKKAIVKVSNYSERLEHENASLKQQLSVALEALNKIANSNHPYDYFTKHTAQITIQQIQGIDNTK